MEEIKSFGLIICVLMVLMAYLKQAIPKGKTTYLMKAIISIFILISIVNAVRTFDVKALTDLMNSSYTGNEEIWSRSAELVAEGLYTEFNRFLTDENIHAKVEKVEVDASEDSFEIQKIIVSGQEAETARNLLAGRYQIGIIYIEVKNE
ncbi:MAG: hypothetical protein IJ043_07555 [Clostridia bacterium]|nr:hypothetical protein [Clostridia bacterium]